MQASRHFPWVQLVVCFGLLGTAIQVFMQCSGTARSESEGVSRVLRVASEASQESEDVAGRAILESGEFPFLRVVEILAQAPLPDRVARSLVAAVTRACLGSHVRIERVIADLVRRESAPPLVRRFALYRLVTLGALADVSDGVRLSLPIVEAEAVNGWTSDADATECHALGLAIMERVRERGGELRGDVRELVYDGLSSPSIGWICALSVAGMNCASIARDRLQAVSDSGSAIDGKVGTERRVLEWRARTIRETLDRCR